MRSTLARLLLAALAASLLLAVPGASASSTGATETYLVLYKSHAVPNDAARTVSRAGGTLVATYPEIGVLVARSADAAFDDRLRADNRVEGAASTAGFGVAIVDDADASDGPPPGDLPNAPASDGDETFWAEQWDMRQIRVPEAHAITGGSPAVVVGNIDTGLDKDHPDLVANIDFSKSVSCESGAADSNPAAWDDRHGHGTHTAGTIAAADNGKGIIGVAPNVKVAGIKASTDEGYFFPEMVVCAFMHAGRTKMDVTNNSYYADPWLYNCRNDAVQRAIWKAEMRAIRYAMQEGVTVVASAGNGSSDKSHPTYDDTSPDYPPGLEEQREITNACVTIPVEIPGVIGVSANGPTEQTDGDDDATDYLKSFYSDYGVSVVDLVAPGGDSRNPGTTKNGRVLSTWPSEIGCARSEQEVIDPAMGPTKYCYAQGTSMAGPHVAGVAALIISRYGDLRTPHNGKLRPNQVEAYLQQTADPQPCPTTFPAPGTGPTNFPTQLDGSPQSCQGGEGHNSWYGNGRVDALSAITR